MRSSEHSAFFYLSLAKQQRQARHFAAAYESLQQIKNTKAFVSEMQNLFLDLSVLAANERIEPALALAWQSFAIRILAVQPRLFGDDTVKMQALLEHQLAMLGLAASFGVMPNSGLIDRLQDILAAMTVDLIICTPRDNQDANLVRIFDLNQISARLVGQEDDPAWYRDTYLDLAASARTHGLFELQDRLCQSSSVYADFIKKQVRDLLFARQPDSGLEKKAEDELQAFADYLRKRRSFSR